MRLKKGLLVKDGKDEKKEEILFALDDEIIVSKTQVAEVRTLFVNNQILQNNVYVEGVYMAPKASMADGIEKDFNDPGPKNYPALGAKYSKYIEPGKTDFKPYPSARIGFILASPVLLLNEGSRTVDITLACKFTDNCELDAVETDKKKGVCCDEGETQREEDDKCHEPPAYLETNKLYDSVKKMLLSRFFVINEDLIKETVKKGVSETVGQKIRNIFLIDYCHTNQCCTRQKNYKQHTSVKSTYWNKFLKSTKLTVGELEIINEIFKEKSPFKILFSGEKEWIQSSETPVIQITGDATKFTLQITVLLKADKPAVTFYDKEKLKEDFNTKQPLINPSPPNCNISPYTHQYHLVPGIFISLPLKHVDEVSFKGLKKLDSNTRNSFLKMTLKCQDFQHERYPFILGRQMTALGKLPQVIDGAVYFNINSAGDLRMINLDEILNDISDNYRLADDSTLNPETIRQKIAFLKANFHDDGTGTIDNPVLVNSKFFADIIKPSFRFPESPTHPDLHKALEAIFDFLKLRGEEIKGFKNRGVVIPNVPWTPIISSMEINYTATAKMEQIDLIHLYPYQGTHKHVEIQSQPSLLPVFCDEGTLFIALKDLEPGSNVNILFQFAEATADSESEKETVYWQFLDNNQWKNLRQGFEVLDDATDGLTTSGVIKFSLPGNISTGNSIMPKDFYWIKASVQMNSTSASELISLHAQAMSATFTNTSANDKNRLSKPLPAGAISKLEVADANVKKVDQPYEAFNGIVPEQEGSGNYYTRISELLRHKGRAIQKFDYERIALEAFPQLYKAKCINHSFALNAHQYFNDFPMAPGYVILAVIPDLNKLKAGGSFEPKVPVSLLDKIETYLRLRTSPFVRLRAMNPRYEKMNICLKVKLVLGYDESYYKEKIIQDLRVFLAPWAIGEYSKLTFG